MELGLYTFADVSPGGQPARSATWGRMSGCAT